MEKSDKKRGVSIFKNLGFAGIGLCALCCLLPIVGTVLGISALGIVAAYAEKLSLILLITSAMFLIIWYMRKRVSAPACDINCSTNPNKKTI